MKRLGIKGLSLALCSVLLFSVCFGGGSVAAETDDTGNDTVEAAETAPVLTVENEQLTLSLDTGSGQVCVTDRRSQKRWYSNPVDAAEDENASGVTRTNLLSQVLVKYKDGNSITALNNYAGSIKNGGAAFSASGNTIRADFTFKKADLVIPVVYSIEGGIFSAEIRLDEMQENGSCAIHTIELLPFFGAGGLQDEGYLFVPDGAGALIDFNNEKAEYPQYEKPVYGEDTTLLSDAYALNSEKIRIPVFGLKSGDHAFAAYICSGAESASIAAAVSGFLCSYNRVSSAVTYRSVETLDLKDHTGKNVTGVFTALNHIDTASYRVEYTFLNGADANVAGMAAVTRERLAAQRQSRSLKQRLVLDLYGATHVEKAFLGIRYTGTRTLTTYEQALAILQDLKESGVSDMDVAYRCAAPGAVGGGLSLDVKPWKKLGGSKAYAALSAYAADNAIRMYPYADLQRYAKSSGGFFTLTDSAMGLDLVPAKLYGYSSVTRAQDKTTQASYLLAPQKLAAAEKKLLKSVRSHRVDGLLLEEVAGSLYSDFSRKGYLRDKARLETEQILRELSSETGLMLADPNDYAFEYAEVITDLPMGSSGCRLFDRDVPFLQMVLHGLVDYTGRAVNLDGITQKEILDTIATGSQLKFALMSESAEAVVNTPLDCLYSAGYTDRADTLKALYRKVAAVNQAVLEAQMISYRNDGQLSCTGYDNGVQVVVNYTDKALELDGKTVPAHDCLVIE